jgi:glycosyltransferase involved in cell wall biosynthesis
MGNEIKILHVIAGLGTGGCETQLYKLLAHMDKQQFDHFVISLTTLGATSAQIANLGIPMTALRMPRGIPTISGLLRLKKIAAAFSPDIIQGWMYHGNLAALSVCSINNKIPICWNIRHSLHEYKKEKLFTRLTITLNKLFSKTPAHIIYNSAIAARQHEEFGFDSTRTRIIQNGFDTDYFTPDDSLRKKIRKELSIDEDAIVVGLFGRYHPLKDHDNFLNAASIVSRKYPNVVYLLAGTNVDNHNQKIISKLAGLSVRLQIRLLGERHDLVALNNAIDISVLSSSSESFPNVVGEAMSCGIPCVITAVGEAPTIVEKTGIIVPAKNPSELANGILAFIENEEKRIIFGKQARLRIIDNYNLKNVIKQYEGLYSNGKTV